MINKKLPSVVYVPFVNEGTRNNLVLNICIEETRMFLTKERAPFLICLEVCRPEELTLEIQDNTTQSTFFQRLKDSLQFDRVDDYLKNKLSKLSQAIRIKD